MRTRTAVLAEAHLSGTHQQVVRAKKRLAKATKALRQARRVRNRAC